MGSSLSVVAVIACACHRGCHRLCMPPFIPLHPARGPIRVLIIFEITMQQSPAMTLHSKCHAHWSHANWAHAHSWAAKPLRLPLQVPLDGDIVYGEAQVSMQHITGEAMPSRQSKGSSVPAGSQNHDGILVVRVTALSDDSTVARISKMAADAQVPAGGFSCSLDDLYTWCIVHSFDAVESCCFPLLLHIVLLKQN